jgi:hypothetical protein
MRTVTGSLSLVRFARYDRVLNVNQPRRFGPTGAGDALLLFLCACGQVEPEVYHQMV